ncbi:hypothetical protein PDO_3682, partial [Rhizobium sp. PDO1-076]|uniref:hypothetical protein n=1 Tax=Rhizobium sp. PDO1-076 TaxID=1125979 RepID=UPI00024E2467
MQTLAVIWASLKEFLTTESILVAIAMAATTVIGLIFGRYEIRLRRLRMIRDYIAAFPTTAGGDGAQGINPSFEFVRTKYSADVEPYAPPPEASRTPPNGEPGAKENADELVSQITATIEQTHRFGRQHDRQLLLVIAALRTCRDDRVLHFTHPFMQHDKCDLYAGSCAQPVYHRRITGIWQCRSKP